MTAPRVLLPVRIAGTSSFAPGPAVATAEIVERVRPPRSAARVEASTGIVSRHFAPPDELPSTLATRALRDALASAGVAAGALERIILVGSGGGELLLPATANLVAAGLGLSGSCDCFDLNNGCMGFLTAFDIAARGIAGGAGPVGIAVVELASRVITPEDPRPYLVFGDAVAAAVLAPARDGAGVLGAWLRNDGVALGNVRLANPLGTKSRETIRFTAPSARMLGEMLDAMRRGVDAVLGPVGVPLADVEWVVPHQPNGAMLDVLLRELGIEADRVVPVAHDVGSVGAASIPTSLDRLLRQDRVRPGDRILMVGVGAGISMGAVLYRAGD